MASVTLIRCNVYLPRMDIYQDRLEEWHYVYEIALT